MLDSKLTELHIVQMKRDEILRRNRVSDILNVLAEHLNRDLEDKLSLAVSRIWGSELKPVNFRVVEWLYPEATIPKVSLYAEVTATIYDASSRWYKPPPRYATVLAMHPPRLCDSNQLTVEITRAIIKKTGHGELTFRSGGWQVFELPQVKNPEELLSETVDLLVEPQKPPLRDGPYSFWTFFRYW